MRTLQIWIAATTLLALCNSARADTEVSMRVSSQVVNDSGYAAFSTTTGLTEVGLGAARSLATLWRTRVWAEASYQYGHPVGAPFGGDFNTDVILHTATLGARIELPIWSWLVPEVRAGVGVLLGKMSFADTQTTASGWSDTFTTYVLGGVELMLPQRWRGDIGRWNWGLLIEGGWVAAGDLHFVLTPDTPDDKLVHTKTTSTDFGALSMSGPTVRVGFLMRF